ncbi:MAG: hypothetical protein KA163_01160 [Bacteroidia bacterium]|nr:hypothetical protein [Bacteroidia bacterium]
MPLKHYMFLILFSVFTFQVKSAGFPNGKLVVLPPDTIKKPDSTAVVTSAVQTQLASDEGIKCTRAELLEKEFVAVGKSKYGEILRITFQDLERGGREIIFQKKLMENDEVKFYMPFDLVKEAKTAVLIVMKGEGMFFKKLDITD